MAPLHSGQSITARGATSADLPAYRDCWPKPALHWAADDGVALILEEATALPDGATNIH